MLPLAEDKFSLYAGPVIGYTSYKESADDISLDLSGFHYGAQAGAILRIVENVEIEAGYRYLLETGSDTVTTVKIDADNIKMWYVGANIRF
jgi:opacity protein-like surface antigen